MEAEPLSPSDPLASILILPIGIGTITGITVIIILLFLSALISGSEVAYFSLKPADMKKFTQGRRDQLVRRHLNNPDKLLATILVANNSVNVGIVVIGAFVTTSLFNFSNSPALEFIIQTVIITFLLLMFGEILPKVYASYYQLAFARFMAYPLSILEMIFRPLNVLLIKSTSIVNKRLKKKRKEKDNISMDEISQALELTSEDEISEEKDILEGIVKFGNKNVGEIMCPRVDVTAVEIRSGFSEVLAIIDETGYSRIPAYSESFDNIKGILFIKDLLPHVEKKGFNWQSLLRPPFFVPETRKIDALLEDFQKNKVHMAIVVDEYGGSAGIVTLEDVLEEIVGDIADEFDEDEHFYSRLSDKKFVFDGKTSLIDFCRITGIDEETFDDMKGEADTLAGLILEIKGEFPVLKEKINCKKVNFSIEAVDKRRIRQIGVEIL